MFVANKIFDGHLLFSMFSLLYVSFSSLSKVSFKRVVDTRLVNSSALVIVRASLFVPKRYAIRLIKSLTSSSTSVEHFPKSFKLLKYTVSVQYLSLISSGKFIV